MSQLLSHEEKSQIKKDSSRLPDEIEIASNDEDRMGELFSNINREKG